MRARAPPWESAPRAWGFYISPLGDPDSEPLWEGPAHLLPRLLDRALAGLGGVSAQPFQGAPLCLTWGTR